MLGAQELQCRKYLVTAYYVFFMCLSRSIRVNLNSRLKVCPNMSTMVSTRVWLSVPNLSMVSSRGNVQFSGCPPSNEQVILAMGLLALQI